MVGPSKRGARLLINGATSGPLLLPLDGDRQPVPYLRAVNDPPWAALA
jgi:hypothetical protein